ncbi:MAG: nucleoside triphosphate pyrophosphohydrolase [Eubacteriaceae bacterium]|jgi:predicted house-cleaning noncanonical NTP pyrophosphatase (MazG superfamily)|nr:nucleoside triphosphate pyrophosphohydrolase [Eubacteriaceae bacterium]
MRITSNTLVRDKIPTIIKDSGRDCDYKILENDEDMKNALNQKLKEKAEVFANNPTADELSDLYDLLKAFEILYEYEPTYIDYLRLQNKENKGSYSGRVFLESFEDLQDD